MKQCNYCHKELESGLVICSDCAKEVKLPQMENEKLVDEDSQKCGNCKYFESNNWYDLCSLPCGLKGAIYVDNFCNHFLKR